MKLTSRLSVASALLVVLSGCGTPRGLEPLDLSPPKADRGLWEYDRSGYLRYDGHPLGRVYVQESDKPGTEWDVEGERQPAGVYEARSRTLVRDDGTSVELLAVGTLAEPAYFEAVAAQVASADVVVVAIRAKGDDAPATAAQAQLARGTVEALHGRVAYVGDALVADPRWIRARPDEDAVLRREEEAPDEEDLDEAVAGLRELADEHGPEVAIHAIVVSRVRPREGYVFARRGPIGEVGYPLDVPDDALADMTWEARDLRDACLKALAPALAGAGPQKVALLVPALTARAVAGALVKQGFVVREERWLPVIHLAR